uniref:ATPEG4 n=1 Tax=Euglena gracilis TaxID=3039 RepID=UPI0012B67D9A|nr:Chain P, ATPEG4 [Euglena gracilis]6TDU_p Chain p, ATPEG4 [Euglena gracilis]6TDV_P Chain P, ATPEG4 [Euglena gracilis]6TDV_p Chain p, ATPEG4 [Euglena gracilis]|eukprot:EG_transcript_49361
MGGDAHAAPAEKPDPALDATKALPKALEEVEFFQSYAVRRKTGFHLFNRATGSPTIVGPMFYNLYNFVRIGRVSKYVCWLSLPLVFQRMWMKNRATGMEYDIDLENYAPFEAKKNPMHGH